MSDGLDLLWLTKAFERDNRDYRERVRRAREQNKRAVPPPAPRDEYDRRLMRLDRQIYLCPVCDQRTLPNSKHYHKEEKR